MDHSPPTQDATSLQNSTEALVTKLKEKLNPNTLGNLAGLFRFKISSLGEYNLSIQNGQLRFLEPTESHGTKPDLILETSLDTITQIMNGSLNPQLAFMSGKLSLTGDMNLALKLAGLLQ